MIDKVLLMYLENKLHDTNLNFSYNIFLSFLIKQENPNLYHKKEEIISYL